MLDSSVVRCKAIVDLGALRANYDYLLRRAGKGAVLSCVVKADAYGHGSTIVARALAEAGARHFATASLAEAVALRVSGVGGSLLVLGGIEPGKESEAWNRRVYPLVSTLGQLRRWNAEGRRQRRRLPCHLCLNTGMNRLGIDFDPSRGVSARALLASLAECAWVEPCGVATHHAAAEDFESGQAEDQERVFAEAAGGTSGCRIRPEVRAFCEQRRPCLQGLACRQCQPGRADGTCRACSVRLSQAARRPFAVRPQSTASRPRVAGAGTGCPGRRQGRASWVRSHLRSAEADAHRGAVGRLRRRP